MNQEVILLSSTDSKDSSNANSVVSINTESSYVGRVPVSWSDSKSDLKREKLLPCTTPSGVVKVKNWMQQSTLGYLANGDGGVCPNKNCLIVCQYDFDKTFSVPSSTPSVEPVNKNKSESAHGPFKSLSVELEDVRKNTKRLLNKPLRQEQIERPVKVDENCCKNNDVKSDSSSDVYEMPLSPESQKKELYHYLKLMNPADKKVILSIQNRRSTRVKNLTLMQEKKVQEQKLKNRKDSEYSDDGTTMKSLKELNMVVESESEEEHFKFPFPQKRFTEKISNFDSIMSSWAYNVNRNQTDRNSPWRKRLANILKMRRLVREENKIEKWKVRNKKVNKKKFKRIARQRLNREIASRQVDQNHSTGVLLPKKKSLRSAGILKGVGIKKLMLKQSRLSKLKKRRKLQEQERNKKKLETNVDKKVEAEPEAKDTALCEIVTVNCSTDDACIESYDYIDNSDFNNLSEEHKKCLIRSRILSMTPKEVSERAISPLLGFDKKDSIEAEKANNTCKELVTANVIEKPTPVEESEETEIIEYSPKIVKENPPSVPLKLPKNSYELLCEIEKDFSTSDVNKENTDINEYLIVKEDSHVMVQKDDDQPKVFEVMSPQLCSEPLASDQLASFCAREHDYADFSDSSDSDSSSDSSTIDMPNGVSVKPFNDTAEMQPLQETLISKNKETTEISNWDLDNSQHNNKIQGTKKDSSHSIYISKEHGIVLNAFYIDFNLIVSQEFAVSIWTQSALGNVLGAQNMWVPKGRTKRIVLNGNCIQKESKEMVFSSESTLAYVELWTKEHKSEKRQRPVADVFATVYFWKQRKNGLDKKVLQIENINGFADDVQYVVLKKSAKIIVSWHSVTENSKITCIRQYSLADDFTTATNEAIEHVKHYVSSLHNIQDCDNLLMGCGENKITLWNIEHGDIVCTIELTEIKSPLSTHWVKCDRGFLFTLQQCVDRELRLIAINGINRSWKRLQSYNPPDGYERLKGVCIENGILVSFYDNGILCWNAQTGDPVVEDSTIDGCYIPSGSHIIQVVDDQILVRHALTHLLTLDDT